MGDNQPKWPEMTADEVAREYSPSSAIGGDFLPFVEAYQTESDRARASCKRMETLGYGPLASNTIDIALPDGPAKGAIVYIHGGYWQHHSKLDSFFGAHVFAEQGIAYAAVDYTLTPAVTLPEIVAECRAALRLVFAKAPDLGIDPSNIVVAGSSAGGHLSAMCCADPELGPKLSGAVLLSGIFDLEPFLATPDNETVGLTLADVPANSPLRLPAATFPNTVVTWGERETDEFKRQSRAMASHISAAGQQVHIFESADRNHFDVVHNLYDPSTELGAEVLNLMEARD